MSLIEHKRAELEALKQKAVMVFIGALKKDVDTLRQKGIIHL